MNINLFKIWLIKNGYSSKVASDQCSRLKKLNNSLISSLNSTTIDLEIKKDNCKNLIASFSNNGNNSIMNQYKLDKLPIGKKSIHTYKLSLKKYLKFKKDYPNG